MKTNFVFLLILMLLVLPVEAQDRDNKLQLRAEVLESFANLPLNSAKVVKYNPVTQRNDTLPMAKLYTSTGLGERQKAYATVYVSRTDSIVRFEVIATGYLSKSVEYKLENVGRREVVRALPPIILDRAPRELQEVIVRPSQVKFYHKGDTLVYNADAFQLGEGSMFDELISQLPGVKLNNEGQITFNGKYVEYLLLNGRDFMNSNRKLMLDNLAAYTVKNIEVYEGQTQREKWENDTLREKHLTMNVKLKKEYSTGLILNLQGGAGTYDRYLGKTWASWFSPTTMVIFSANVNNLNDNRTPGKNDSWTPQMLPIGTKRFADMNLGYDVTPISNIWNIHGNTRYENNGDNTQSVRNATNFLPSSVTYQWAFNESRSSSQKLYTSHTGQYYSKLLRLSTFIMGQVKSSRARRSGVSGTFNIDPGEVTQSLLDTLYNRTDIISDVVNRSITKFDQAEKEAEINIYPSLTYKIPGSNDHLSIEPGLKFSRRETDSWNSQTVNFGSDCTPSINQRNYTKGSPNQTLTAMVNVSYKFSYSRAIHYGLNYEYRFVDQQRNSDYYALERLMDMGVFGILPSGYMNAFDPVNSYSSRSYKNQHELSPDVALSFSNPDKYEISIQAKAGLRLQHQLFSYHRAYQDYRISRTYLLPYVSSSQTTFIWGFTPVYIEQIKKQVFKNRIQFSMSLDATTPSAQHLIDFVDCSDPMNISVGNPDLRCAYKQNYNFEYRYSLPIHSLTNRLSGSLMTAQRDLVRGYVYDTSSGVCTYRTYNVNGNYVADLRENVNWLFGSINQFCVNAGVSGRVGRNSDMIGVNQEQPTKSTVTNYQLQQNLKFDWHIGRQSIGIVASNTYDRSLSDREDFKDLSVRRHSLGANCNLKFPYGLTFTSDFNLYARRGYGMMHLDTTDPIWNVRLSFTRSKFTLMLDGFDILQQLTNVSYFVTPSGRTVSYTNTLPKYVMITLQYRFNRTPKER